MHGKKMGLSYRAIVVMKISFQRDTRLGLSIAGFGTTLFFKSVAVVPAVAVFCPRTHAHPTEFVFAFAASHMVATAVLLDRRVALRAFFGVC